MRIFTIAYRFDPYGYYQYNFGGELTPIDLNFRDYGHEVKQRKPFNQRAVKGKSRESKSEFHSNEKSGYDPDIISEMNNETECYNARFIKYKPSPRNKAKARWSKGGDNMARINCEFAMRPHCYRYDGRIEWDSSCNIGANKGRAWWRDAHQYAYLKYSLCTKGVDGITGWCDFGGKWMKRKLSKHERRNGKKEAQDQINDLYNYGSKYYNQLKEILDFQEMQERDAMEDFAYFEAAFHRSLSKEEEDWCYDEFYDIPDYGPSDDWDDDRRLHHTY